MGSLAMQAWATWLLILLTSHTPFPCPDLDGECRGTPIESLAEMQAWHVLLLGIRPNDDIDRGPIRPSDSEYPDTPDETPLGKLAVVSAAASNTASSDSLGFVESIGSAEVPLLVVDSSLSSVAPVWRWPQQERSTSRRLARLCVWRV